MLRNIAVRILLVCVSVLIALIAVELSLRRFVPRYEYAAESKHDADSLRIWSRVANTHTVYHHPDSGKAHAVIYNNLAMRQHRDFTPQELQGATNIGFFGDSQTENLRVAAPYSFTEPLDYLANLSGRSFNVLNFGVGGYGTDQCYLYYLNSPLARDLQYVFYVVSANDLRNIFENDLFRLHDGVLHRNSPRGSPWWVRLMSGLHLTYFLLDTRLRLKGSDEIPLRKSIEYWYSERRLSQQRDEHRNRFHSERADAIERDLAAQIASADLEHSIDIFRAILKQWRQDVEAKGARFYVVLLPKPTENLFARIVDRDFNVVNLYARFSSVIEAYAYDKHVRFANDGHWNELGNLLAAVELYRVLERDINLPMIPDERLKAALYSYYTAFRDEWTPPSHWVTKVSVSPTVLSAIRQKYIALELDAH